MVMMAQGKIAQSNFNRILNLFRTFSSICADFHFGEKMPGCLYFFFRGVSLPTGQRQEERLSLCTVIS